MKDIQFLTVKLISIGVPCTTVILWLAMLIIPVSTKFPPSKVKFSLWTGICPRPGGWPAARWGRSAPSKRCEWWSWGESNPRPKSEEHKPLRPFPGFPLRLGSCRVNLPLDLSPVSAVFAGCQRSFPAVRHRFCCQAAMSWPRVPAVAGRSLLTQLPRRVRLREALRLHCRRVWCCPV